MIDPKIIDELAKKVTNILPGGAREIQQDIEKNVRAMLSATFEKLEIATREELDVQKGVLARTRAKLDALEKQVAELEKNIHGK